MGDFAIRATDLSKRFLLQTEKRTALKERMVRGRSRNRREVWALRDASFEVRRGEALGIIGHNGSGKSTALKVITGVYRPTSGSVQINGRVSALLELGAGFHPELTGRENIYLNGSILGLGRRQIESLEDEIVDFAGIEDFIDAPVKVYSSGMFVRLGFSIAAKLDPDILIMDEVIAVGDEQFQRKCYDYLFDLRSRGSTIVIVSHSMGSIEQVCDRAMWISKGEIQALGGAHEVTQAYLDSVNSAEVAAHRVTQEPRDEHDEAPGSGEIRVTGVDFVDAAGEPTDVLLSRERARLRIHYRARTAVSRVVFGFLIHNEVGVDITGRSSAQDLSLDVAPGTGTVEYAVDDLLLREGTYQITTMVSSRGRIIDAKNRAYHVKVRSTDQTAGGAMVLPGRWRQV